jgi:transcriptional regulator with XRE-family HTH domain
MSTMEFEVQIRSDEDDKALELQDRFVHGFSGLRKRAGMSQRDLAREAGWHQPYVQRLEDANSPLLRGLSRLERYAQACGVTAVLTFVDKETGEVARTLPLDDAGEAMAERLLSQPGDGEASLQVEDAENQLLDDEAAWQAAHYDRA